MKKSLLCLTGGFTLLLCLCEVNSMEQDAGSFSAPASASAGKSLFRLPLVRAVTLETARAETKTERARTDELQQRLETVCAENETLQRSTSDLQEQLKVSQTRLGDEGTRGGHLEKQRTEAMERERQQRELAADWKGQLETAQDERAASQGRHGAERDKLREQIAALQAQLAETQSMLSARGAKISTLQTKRAASSVRHRKEEGNLREHLGGATAELRAVERERSESRERHSREEANLRGIIDRDLGDIQRSSAAAEQYARSASGNSGIVVGVTLMNMEHEQSIATLKSGADSEHEALREKQRQIQEDLERMQERYESAPESIRTKEQSIKSLEFDICKMSPSSDALKNLEELLTELTDCLESDTVCITPRQRGYGFHYRSHDCERELKQALDLAKTLKAKSEK